MNVGERAPGRGLVGHADLLRVAAALVREGLDLESGLAEAARVLGLERVPPKTPRPAPGPPPVMFEPPAEVEPSPDPSSPASAPENMPLWQPITFTWSDDEVAHQLEVRLRVNPAEDAAADQAERDEMDAREPPSGAQLSPRSRLVPMLQRALTADNFGRDVDIPGLIRRWSRGELLARLPRLRRRGWPALVLLLDRAFHLVPFWRDELVVRDLLRSLVGGAGLVVRFFDDRGPDGPAFDERGRRTDLLDGSLAGLPVLALTDLGWYGGPRLSRSWLRLGRQLRRAGERICALVPVPASRWTPALTQVWTPMPWERPGAAEPLSPDEQQTRADRLLDLAAHAHRLEPGLLRALRLLLPRSQADVGTEADAWMHDDIAAMSADATALRPDRVQARRERFAQQTPELRERVAEVLRRWHWHNERGPELWHMEALSVAASGREAVGEATLARAENFMGRLARRAHRMSRETGPWEHVRALRRWLDHVAERNQPVWNPATAAGRDLQIAWWATHDEDEPPPEADPTLIAAARGEPPGAPRMYELRQVGEALEIWSPDALRERRTPPGRLVAPLWAAAPVVYLVETGRAPQRLSLAEPTPLPVAPGATLELRTDRARLNLGALHKPAWATAIGRDHHGLWADVEVRDVPFRLRWIPPGRFLMGSPENEGGRESWEGPQREVVISRGFWLGEAPVTQALWRAATGGNPSGFQYLNQPVEQVSWGGAQEFVGLLNDLLGKEDGDQFRLPTEAEWEYACRAGTTTATYAGDPEILNDYNAPTLDAIAWYRANSEARCRPAMQKRPNHWGLYDMLGNVWEWCADTWGRYRAGMNSVTDPVATGSDGASRVARGGGWNSPVYFVRAACRRASPAGNRSFDQGLRLARGQEIQYRVKMSAPLVEKPVKMSPPPVQEPVKASPPPVPKEASPPPVQRPHWASIARRDEYGVFACLVVRTIEYRMRWIPSGRFLMGSPGTEEGRWVDEGPQHEVFITRGFWLGETPVTQALWRAVMGKSPSHFTGLDHPVEKVSWDDCQQFCAQLNALVRGLRVRLPSEAEWEYACRSGMTEPTYPSGELWSLDDIAWWSGNSSRQTHPVGQKTPNAWGLHDMLGNVWEWCNDGMRVYGSNPVLDPAGRLDADRRVFRGGCWSDSARYVRAACRAADSRDYRSVYLGLRLARSED